MDIKKKEKIMIQVRKTLSLMVMACFVIFILTTLNLSAAGKSAFSIGDSLRLKSFSAQSMTDDGRFIADSISVRLDRLGTDHKRYGDPTYLSPRAAEIVILDTETKKITPLFESKKWIQSMTWSPDGKTLAFFLHREGRFYLQTYDRIKKSFTEIKLKTESAIASNSFLVWTSFLVPAEVDIKSGNVRDFLYSSRCPNRFNCDKLLSGYEWVQIIDYGQEFAATTKRKFLSCKERMSKSPTS